MPKTSLRAAWVALFLMSGVAAAPAAVDPMRIASAITTAAVATGELHITYEKVAAKGDDVIHSNVELTVGSDNDVSIPSLVISGPVERPGGGFTAKRMTFDGGSTNSPEGKTNWATGSIEDIVVPSRAEIDGHAKIRPFRKLTLGTMGLSQTRGQPMSIASFTVDVGEVSDTVPATVHLVASGAKVPIGFVNNPLGSAMLARMGYTEFEGGVVMDAVYDTSKNSIAVNSLVVDAPKVGKLAFAAKFSGTSLGGIADPDEATAARAAARLDSVMVRFEDGGFVGRMLNMQADLYGGSKDDVRDALVYGALPLVLNYVENQAFRAQFMDAAEAFLSNPKSFTITATPPMPVPLGETIRAALHEPLKLPDLLKPQVAANK
jgi:hypothetical protein